MESDLFDEWADEDCYESDDEEDWYVDLWIYVYISLKKNLVDYFICIVKEICFWVNIVISGSFIGH